MRTYKKIVAIVLTVFFTLPLIIPTFASDIQNKVLTLEEIQDLAIQNSRIVKNMDLTLDQADRQVRILKSDLNKLKYGTSVSMYDSIKGLEELKGSLESMKKGLDQTKPEDAIMLQNINTQLAITNKSLMDLSQQRSSISSAQKQLKNALEDAEDIKEDLERMVEDLESQLRYTVTQTVFNLYQMEDSLNILEKTYDYQLKMTEITRLQKELGMVTTVDVDNLAVQASTTYKQLQQLKESYQVAKRALNDLIGREPDAQLHIQRYKVMETLTPVPSYETIIGEIKKNAYELYKMDRDTKKLEDDLDETDGSNEKLIAKADIEKAKLSRIDKELEIENKVKSILAGYNEKLKAYQLAQVELKTAEQSHTWNQKRFELGMITEVQLKGSELSYLNAKANGEKAAFNYYLAKIELEMLKKGISTTIGSNL
ncbi:MAG: TolC family protein [Clostridia bacterium]|nr:TolC family protein [Clostridia bacterium]